MSDARVSLNVTRVAVGVLLRADGNVLLADRPFGKPYPGYWEFPGGKVEPGEAIASALARELQEELGIDIGPAQPWVTFEFDYPHAYVQLHFYRIRSWRGEPHPHEGQQLRFVDPIQDLPQPLLPAAVPALRWLRLPDSAIVVGANGIPRSAEQRLGAARRIVVMDTDSWPPDGCGSTHDPGRRAAIRRADLLLACGSRAADVPGRAGVVLDVETLRDRPSRPAAGWCGAWINSSDQMALAKRFALDFALVSAEFYRASLKTKPAAIPVLVAAPTSEPVGQGAGQPAGHGRWFDLRGPDSCA